MSEQRNGTTLPPVPPTATRTTTIDPLQREDGVVGQMQALPFLADIMDSARHSAGRVCHRLGAGLSPRPDQRRTTWRPHTLPMYHKHPIGNGTDRKSKRGTTAMMKNNRGTRGSDDAACDHCSDFLLQRIMHELHRQKNGAKRASLSYIQHRVRFPPPSSLKSGTELA